MNEKFRLWIQHGHINDTTLRCDIREYCYWTWEGRKTPSPRFCVCKSCKEYRDKLRKEMVNKINKQGAKAVLDEINNDGKAKRKNDDSIWDAVDAA